MADRRTPFSLASAIAPALPQAQTAVTDVVNPTSIHLP